MLKGVGSFDAFGLSLASLEPEKDAPELETGPLALVMHAEAPQKEGVGQRDRDGEETNSTGDGDAVLAEDTPP